MSFLNLWRYLGEQRKERSGSSFRRMCRDEFLHYLRIREWQDLVGQLRSICRDLGIREQDEPADAARVHAALTAGLLSHIGLREGDGRDLPGRPQRQVRAGARLGADARPPRWVVVADLVETSRLFGRTAARIEPEAVERVAGHLVQRSYSEPHWDAKRGAVMAYERVTLYGLPFVARRRVGYGARSIPRWRASCSSGTRWSRGLADPAPLLPRQRAAAGGTRRARGTGPPPRPAGRRRRDLRVLRRAGARRRRVGPPFRRLVAQAAAPRPRSCSR